MAKGTISISKREYEGMKETIELLQNKPAVKKLIKSLKESKKDNSPITICL